MFSHIHGDAPATIGYYCLYIDSIGKEGFIHRIRHTLGIQIFPLTTLLDDGVLHKVET